MVSGSGRQYALSLSTAAGTTTPPTATPATLGSVISGSFSSGNSTARYEFADMAAGTYFVDGIQALTTNWYTGQPAIGSIQWQAQSVTGAILAQGAWGSSGGMPGMGGNNSNPDDRPSADGLLVVPAGTYRIQLQSYVNGTLSYQFKVSAINPDATTLGDISGQLSSGTQATVYHFSGTAGQHFRLEVDPWGTADEIAQRADRLYPVSGNAEEDGVTAILKALQGLNFRAGSSRQIVLVTDESRAIQDPTATSSRLLTELKKLRVTLHSVLNNPLRADLPGDGVPDLAHDFTDVMYQPNIFAPIRFEVVGASMGDVNLGLPHGSTLLGVDAHGGSFRILPNGGIEPGAPTTISTLDDLIDAAYRDDWANILDFVNTSEDLAVLAAAMNYFDDYWATINSQYADPAVATGGSVWDLNQLRKEPYNVSLNDGGPGPEHPATEVHYDPAKSFSNAFAQMIQRAVAESLPFSLASSTNTAPYQILSTSYANGVVTFNVEFQGDGHNYDFGLQVVNTDTGVVSDLHPFQLIATYVAQPQATDADGDPLTYLLVGDAHGATINSQTGAFHWDPVGLNVADGNYSFTVEVGDGRGGTDRKTWSITVGPAEDNNRLPYGTGPLVITAPIDEQVSIGVGNVIGDPDGDPLTFTIDASQLSAPLPDGWKLNRLTGVMTWTPTYDDLRQDAYEFPVLISDGRGGTVTQIVQIHVVDSDVFTNVEPSVSFNLPAEFRSFSSYVLPVSAYDPNGDALAYTIVAMPDGMAWDAQQHRFSWRPTEDQVGQHFLLFRVSDGQGGTASVARVLNVLSSNQLPVFDSDVADSGPAYSGQTWTYHAHATDPDGDLNLIYSIDDDAKAQGAKINPATGELTWFFSDESEHVVTIIVTDTWGGRDGQIVHIPVNPPPQPNAAPIFLSEPVSVATADEEYRWTIDVADPDYDALTFGLDAESRRRGMTIRDGVLVWTEPVKGRYSVSLTAWDDHDGATTLTFTLNVTAQHPPEFRNQPVTTAYVGQPWVYSVYAVDPDEERVLLTLNSAPAGMAFDTNNPTLLRWTPTATGTVTFEIVATDERGAHTTKTVVLTASTWDPNAPAQVAPEFIAQPVGPGYVGTEWSYVVLARDLNHDDITFDLVSGPAGNNGMRLEELTPEELDDLDLPDGVVARILRWTAPISGNFWVELKVNDTTELSATQGFELPIAQPNSPPRDLSGAFDDLYIGLPWQYQILPYDPDGDVVTVTTMEIRQGNSPVYGAEIDGNNRVTWTPTSTGTYALHLVLVDGRGGEYETDITLHVYDAQAEIASWGNPKVVSVPMNPPIAGQPWGFQLIAVDASTPPQDMRVVLRPGSTLPHGLHVEEDGRIWWEVVPYDAGDFSALELRIYDKDNRQTDYTLPMRIITQNLRPEFEAPLAVPPAYVGETWSWDLIVDDPDPENPAVLNVVLDAQSEAAGVYVDSTMQGPDGKWHVTLKWDSPTSSRPITITVYDRDIELSEGTEDVDKLPPVATATVGFVLHLNDRSEGLRITSTPGTTFAAVGKVWQYTPQFTFNGSTTTATFDYSSDIAGLTLDEATGTFHWTPSLLANGNLTITATGGDPAQTVVQTLVLSSYTPYRLNEAPEFTSTGLPGKIERDRAYTAIVQATDANGDVLRYSLDNAAIDAGLSINSRTGVLTWTPHVSGNVSFTVTVTDGELSTEQTYQLRVDPNAAPEMTSLPVTVYPLHDPADENVSLSYSYAVVVDEPNAHDTLTWTLIGPAWLEFDATSQTLRSKVGVTAPRGRYSVLLTVSDNHGATDRQSFEIHVYDPYVNDAPTADTTFRTTVPAEQPLTHQFQAVDPDGDRISFSLAAGHPEGMAISPQGLLSWTPHLPMGVNSLNVTFSIILTDERNAIGTNAPLTVTLAPITVTITGGLENHDPVINETVLPRKYLFANQEFSYQAQASDADHDPVYWALVDAPDWMTVDPFTGRLTGTPPISKIGQSAHVLLVAYDPYGGWDKLEWTVQVKAANDGARFGELVASMIAVDEEYRVDVNVTDPEEGALILRISEGPEGLAVVPGTLQLVATPNTLELGVHTVVLEAEDEFGVLTHYAYQLFVYDPAFNRAPVFDSSPTSTTWFVGEDYSYTPHAVDDNSETIEYGLVTVPPGALWEDGVLTWAPTLQNAGYYTLTFTASDGQYQRVQTIKIQVRDNHAPTIPAVSNTTRTAGQTFALPLTITDADGDQIMSITLDSASLAAGLVWDSITQSIRWNIDTGSTDAGNHIVVLTATDEFGKASTRQFTITVNADSSLPLLDVETNPNPAQTYHAIELSVTATDNVGIATTTVTLTGFSTDGVSFTTLNEAIALNEFGKGSYLPTTQGTYRFHVVATDVNGNISPMDTNVTVKDNLSPPKLEIISPQNNGTIYAPLVITGTIGDSDGINHWQLTLTSQDDPNFVRILASYDFVSVEDPLQQINRGALAELDTTFLANGMYTLTLTATDRSASDPSTSTVTSTFEVQGGLKLGNFTFSAADLTINTPGIPITVSRTYDTLLAGRDLDFGYGWKWDLGEPKVDIIYSDTSLTTFEGNYVPFRDGTRVVVSLPDGTQQGFTFRPYPIIRNGYGFGLGVTEYAPYFEPDAGVLSFLELDKKITLVQVGHQSSNEYLIQTADGGSTPYAFNPAAAASLNNLVLYTGTGARYGIDPSGSGHTWIEDRKGNRVEYIPNGSETIIRHHNVNVPNGVQTDVRVVFSNGNISQVIDPQGNTITYQYTNGKLTSVTDRMGYTTQYNYLVPGDTGYPIGNSIDPHYLKSVVDPLGRTVTTVVYQSTGRLSSTSDAANVASSYSYNVQQRSATITTAGQDVTLQADDRGNLRQQSSPLGSTLRTYNSQGQVISETQVIDELDSTTSQRNDLTVRYNYDAYGRPLSQSDIHGHSGSVQYDSDGNVTRSVDIYGNVTSLKYDSHGNASEVTAGGQTAYMAYDAWGNVLTARQGDNGPTTTNEYDTAGRLVKTIDTTGRTMFYSYAILNDQGVQIGTRNTPTRIWYFVPEIITTGATTTTIQVAIFTETQYDANDRVIRAVQGLQRPGANPLLKSETLTHYNAAGWIDSTTSRTYDPNGVTYREVVTERKFDIRGNVVEMRTTEPAPSGPSGLVTTVQRNVYDTLGRVIYATESYRVTAEGIPLNDSISATHTTYDAETGQTTASERLAGIVVSLSGPSELGAYTSAVTTAGTSQGTSSTEYVDGRVSRTADDYGLVTEYTYDRFGQTTQVRREARAENGDAVWFISRTYFDSYGRATYQTDEYLQGGTDPVLGVQTLYDAQGRSYETRRLKGLQIAIDTDGAARVTTVGTTVSYTNSTFDSMGRVIASRGSDGLITNFEYDSATGRRLATIGPAVLANTVGLLLVGNPLVRLRSETHYNAEGQVDYETSNLVQLPDGSVNESWKIVTSYEYDGYGRVTRTTRDGYGRNETGQLIVLVSTSTGVETRDEGRTLEEIDALGRRKTMHYNAQGQLISVELPAVADPTDGGTLHRPVYTYEYDASGNLTQITYPNGHSTTFTFNVDGQQLTRTLPEGQTEYTYYDERGRVDYHVSFEGVVSQYAYDDTAFGQGRVSEQRFYPSLTAFDDGEGDAAEVWLYRYDVFGRQVAVTQEVTVGPTTTTATYNTEYDSQGRVVRLTSPQGTLSYEYDTLGRKTRTYTGDSVSPVDDWRYRYDALGRLSQIQMVRRNGVAVDIDPYTTGIQPELTGYHYDLAGNLDWQDQPTGVQTDYTYDALQRLTVVAHYTPGYFLDEPADGAKLSQFTYTLLADGTRQQLDETLYYSSQTYGAQEVHNTYFWTYDALNRLTDEEFKTNYDTLFTNGQTPPTDGDRPLASYHDHYVFDLAGNRLSKTTDVGVRTTGGAIAFDGNPEEALTYFYDANDRLLREERNFSDTEQSDTVTLYTYQGTQQTHKTVQIGEPVEGTPQWVSQTDFAWDLQGKLGQITSRSYDDTGTQTGGSTTDYEYAPSGDRVRSQTEEWVHVEVYGGQFEDRVRETTTTYLVDPDNFTGYSQVVKEHTSTTTTVGSNISHSTSDVTSTIGHDVVAQWINGHIAPLTEVSYGPPMGMYFNGTASLLYDGHGSTRQLSVLPYNSSQVAPSNWVIQGYVYDAYGQMLGGSAGKALTNLLYSGEQFDQRAAMQYLRARYYDAGNGRFVGLDQFSGLNHDPQTLHKYLYARTNPILRTDPSGLSDLISTIGTIGIGTRIGFMIAGGAIGAGMGAADAYFGGKSMREGAFWGGLFGMGGGLLFPIFPAFFGSSGFFWFGVGISGGAVVDSFVNGKYSQGVFRLATSPLALLGVARLGNTISEFQAIQRATAALRSQLLLLRDTLGISKLADRNMAVGVVSAVDDLSGTPIDEVLGAVSGAKDPAIRGMAAVPEEPLFVPNPLSNNTHPDTDAEIKLFESFARLLRPGVRPREINDGIKGTLTIYSEFEPCTSCSDPGGSGILQQFQRMFPNVKVNLWYGESYTGNRGF